MGAFELTWDDDEVEKWLEPWREPAVLKTLRRAASAYGRAGRKVLRAATPVAPPGNIYAREAGGAGNLQRSTKSRRIRSNPAIGVVIGPMGNTAYYRHMVTGGTKPHVILPTTVGGRLRLLGGFASAVHHPGARANPYVERARGAVESAGYAAAERVVFAWLEESRRVAESED